MIPVPAVEPVILDPARGPVPVLEPEVGPEPELGEDTEQAPNGGHDIPPPRRSQQPNFGRPPSRYQV